MYCKIASAPCSALSGPILAPLLQQRRTTLIGQTDRQPQPTPAMEPRTGRSAAIWGARWYPGVLGPACPMPPGARHSSTMAQTPHALLEERWSWWKGQSESLHFCFHPSSPNCRVSKLIWVFRLVGFYCRFLKKSPAFTLQTTGLKSPDKFSKCFLQFAFALIHPSVLP